jgi:hypothetical protein
MPETTVIRYAGTAPRVGMLYGFSDGGRTFAGTVIRVTPMRKAKQHVSVTIELTEAPPISLCEPKPFPVILRNR